MKMSKIPTKLKDLLQTGLLEGLHVRYIHGSKGRRRPESELRGVIQGAGILCSCDECKETKIVTPNQFEMHAGSGNKRPPQYIFLDNGKSLRDVLDACKANLSESLETVILNAIGRSNYTTAFCINCKELIPEAGAGRSMLLCDSCVLPKESDASDAQISDTSRRSPLAGPSAPASSSCPPVVPESAQISSDSQPQTKRKGKLTRKDLRMHKSVLAEDVLPEGTALCMFCMERKSLRVTRKTGIFCTCCREVVSPSQFEAHAGFASVESRLLGLQEHDDLCSICEDGGDLLCCANCPRGFHTECVGLSAIPQGIWYCKYCQNMFEKEKFAEPDANALAARRVPGVDPLEAITQRCIRVVGTLEPEIGGCAICRRCQRGMVCGRPCSNIYAALQKLIRDGEQRLPEALSDVLKMKCEGQSLQKNSGAWNKMEAAPWEKGHRNTRAWLSGAVNIFSFYFHLPNFFRTALILSLMPARAVLTLSHIWFMGNKSIEALQRPGFLWHVLCYIDGRHGGGICYNFIFGEEVAELPLVATSECQGKGYFQSLLYCIEGLLASLNVKDLVLPAADEAESMWRKTDLDLKNSAKN
ncbi:UNVERIFIED_CONTAM: Increased DNA methylation 1, partial [Sesamum latifolium]